jgi:outer membrane protein assembly factor BamD (BamD/ComL family)
VPVVEVADVSAANNVPAAVVARSSSRDRELAMESELLAQARDAVAHRQWQDAWTLLEQHRRKFLRGRLAEERESLRVPVLVMLDRYAEARDAAQRFHARYTASIFAAGVNQAIASIP